LVQMHHGSEHFVPEIAPNADHFPEAERISRCFSYGAHFSHKCAPAVVTRTYAPGFGSMNQGRAISSAGERSLHTREAAGSIPASPTIPHPSQEQPHE
jgi:hypothetical protein